MHQPLPGNDNNQTQDGNGGGNQNIPSPNPPPPCVASRVILIQNQMEIVGVLSAIATRYSQPIYISQATGYVSQATFAPLAEGSRCSQFQNGRAQLDSLSGWFYPRLIIQDLVLRALNCDIIPSRLENGALYVCLRHERIPQDNGVSFAISLIASGPVEVNVLFVCRPGSIVQPIAAGGPRELYTIVAQPE